MRQFFGLLLITVIFGVPIADAADVREDMVALDRACIPVSVLLAEGRGDLAVRAMRVTRSEWDSFRGHNYKINTKDADWRKDLDLVSALLFEAATIIDGGRQVALAQEPLERVNKVMTNLRRRNGIDHYFDRVAAFRESLNAIIAAAQGKAPPADAVSLIRTSFPTAMQSWERVLAAKPGPEYRLTAGERDALQAKLDQETAALAALGKALAADDPAAIIAAAVATRPPFRGIYNSFGNFHGLLWEGS